MRAAVMPGVEEIEIIEVPTLEVGEDEVLVRVKAVGICTWEQKFYAGQYGGFPFIGGHEISGIVEKVGSKVSQGLAIGDKVVVASLTRCGECYYCRRGYDNQCENAIDVEKVPGYSGPAGFAEYFVAKGYEVYKISDEIDFAVGTLAEPLACVNHSIDMGKLEIGDYTLILGGGVMGLLHIFLAKEKGATVIVSEPDSARRQNALKLGADHGIDPISENIVESINEITLGKGVDVVFFTAGGEKAIEDGINCLNIRGRLVIYGSTKPSDLITLDPKIFHYNEITITGVTKHTKETFRKAAEIISNNRLPFESLISEKYPFEEIKKAFERSKDMSTYRVIVEL